MNEVRIRSALGTICLALLMALAIAGPSAVPMIVSVNLDRERWYGWDHLANGYASGTKSYVNGNAKWYCAGVGTYTYRGSSYHRATVGGQVLTAYTARSARFAC